MEMPTTLIWAAFVAIAADGGGRGPALPVMLQIDWRRLPDVPAQGPEHQGFQDSDGGWIDDDTVVTAFGYAAGGVRLPSSPPPYPPPATPTQM